MNSKLMKTGFSVASALAVLLALSAVAAAQSIKGPITGRSGATMTVKTTDGEMVTVLLTSSTKVQEKQGAVSSEQ